MGALIAAGFRTNNRTCSMFEWIRTSRFKWLEYPRRAVRGHDV